MTSDHAAPWPDLLERALRKAADCHRDQRRKGSALPYITHPFAVAWILQRFGFIQPELLAAALLHDVVEDTSCELADLQREFPPGVVEIVATLSERKDDAHGNQRSWEDRKREHLNHIATGSLAARTVVLADKLHNLSTILFDLQAGEDVWPRFNATPERMLWYHREMLRSAGSEAVLDGLREACESLIQQLEAQLRKRPVESADWRESPAARPVSSE